MAGPRRVACGGGLVEISGPVKMSRLAGKIDEMAYMIECKRQISLA